MVAAPVPPGMRGRVGAMAMGPAVAVLVLRRVDEDERGGDELHDTENDEGGCADREGVRRDKHRCREPRAESEPAETSRTVGADQMPDLRYVGRADQPGTDEASPLGGPEFRHDGASTALSLRWSSLSPVHRVGCATGVQSNANDWSA